SSSVRLRRGLRTTGRDRDRDGGGRGLGHRLSEGRGGHDRLDGGRLGPAGGGGRGRRGIAVERRRSGDDEVERGGRPVDGRAGLVRRGRVPARGGDRVVVGLRGGHRRVVRLGL